MLRSKVKNFCNIFFLNFWFIYKLLIIKNFHMASNSYKWNCYYMEVVKTVKKNIINLVY